MLRYQLEDQRQRNLFKTGIAGTQQLVGGQTADRLAAYRSALGAHSSDAALAAARATSLLASTVAKQAAVLSYIDGFLAAAVGALGCLMLTALLRRH